MAQTFALEKLRNVLQQIASNHHHLTYGQGKTRLHHMLRIRRDYVSLRMSWPQHAQVTQHLFAGQVCPFAQAGDTRSGRIQHVCVGKYAAPQVFLSDREWCAKNSLHRYRSTLLSFEG